MLESLKREIYPPHYIIDKIKGMNPRNEDFDRLVNGLRSACFRTSMMWKESNIDIFDFLQRYKK